jgi:hypothetical protein
VTKIARGYRGYQLPISELIAISACCRQSNAFAPEKGFRRHAGASLAAKSYAAMGDTADGVNRDESTLTHGN